MLEALVNFFLDRQKPVDDTIWHRWSTPWPVKLIDGRRYLHKGHLWRRKAGSLVEYKWFPLNAAEELEWLDNAAM
jgi:hypothetical protein